MEILAGVQIRCAKAGRETLGGAWRELRWSHPAGTKLSKHWTLSQERFLYTCHLSNAGYTYTHTHTHTEAYTHTHTPPHTPSLQPPRKAHIIIVILFIRAHGPESLAQGHRAQPLPLMVIATAACRCFFVFKPRPYHEFRDSEMTVFPSHQPLLPGAPRPSQSCELPMCCLYVRGWWLPAQALGSLLPSSHLHFCCPCP